MEKYEKLYAALMLQYERTQAKRGRRPALPIDTSANIKKATDTQKAILRFLQSNGPKGIHEIAAHLGKNSSSTSASIRHLADRGEVVKLKHTRQVKGCKDGWLYGARNEAENIAHA